MNKNNPYFLILNELIQDAIKIDASDIHIIPTTSHLEIKLRVCGRLTTWRKLGNEHKDLFIHTAKSYFNLNIAINNIAQDARKSIPSLNIDLRVNSTPLIYGNKIVVRILNKNKNFDLDKSNLNVNIINLLKKYSVKKNGIILLSGQTGSGKTTTLYSILQYLNDGSKNISTIEDPVEYTFEGLDQIDLTTSRDMTFASSLRSLLRQDPDIIFVGEIRDEETAQLCLKAASTGHLVLSTIHANDPKSAVQKFEAYDCDQKMIQELILISLNQLLVPLNCPHCSEILSKQKRKDLNGKIELSSEQLAKKINHGGCDKCSSGITKRIPINEFIEREELEKTSSIDEIIFKRKNELALPYVQSGELDPYEYLKII